MIDKETLDSMTLKQVEERLRTNRELLTQMVGTLYPSILREEIEMALVWECVMSECPNCGETILIRNTVKTGESYECGACGKRQTIDQIISDYYQGKKRIHESEVV